MALPPVWMEPTRLYRQRKARCSARRSVPVSSAVHRLLSGNSIPPECSALTQAPPFPDPPASAGKSIPPNHFVKAFHPVRRRVSVLPVQRPFLLPGLPSAPLPRPPECCLRMCGPMQGLISPHLPCGHSIQTPDSVRPPGVPVRVSPPPGQAAALPVPGRFAAASNRIPPGSRVPTRPVRPAAGPLVPGNGSGVWSAPQPDGQSAAVPPSGSLPDGVPPACRSSPPTAHPPSGPGPPHGGGAAHPEAECWRPWGPPAGSPGSDSPGASVGAGAASRRYPARRQPGWPGAAAFPLCFFQPHGAALPSVPSAGSPAADSTVGRPAAVPGGAESGGSPAAPAPAAAPVPECASPPACPTPAWGRSWPFPPGAWALPHGHPDAAIPEPAVQPSLGPAPPAMSWEPAHMRPGSAVPAVPALPETAGTTDQRATGPIVPAAAPPYPV